MKEDLVSSSFIKFLKCHIDLCQGNTGLFHRPNGKRLLQAMWQNEGKCWPLNGVIERKREWEKEEKKVTL